MESINLGIIINLVFFAILTGLLIVAAIDEAKQEKENKKALALEVKENNELRKVA